MKTNNILSATLLFICVLYSGANWARGHFGFYFGVPFYPYAYPYYPYPMPYYYPPPVVTVPASPPAYIHQSPPTSQQPSTSYWYYCNNPKGYYPYVKQCPQGWQEVEPAPSAPR